MLICRKLTSITFTGKTTEQAYLRGCKYLSSFTKKNDKFDKVVYKAKRLPGDEPAFEFTLYIMLDGNEDLKRACITCKEANNCFFGKSLYKCEDCQLKDTMNKMKRRLDIAKHYHKERIEEL
jgi:hypothetical protein